MTEELRASLSNVEIVTFTLGNLDGPSHPVHLERIAARAFILAPGSFRWDLDEFAEHIDKDKVRVSLVDAQKEKYGGLVKAVGAKRAGISKPADAWQLTPSGAVWYRENKDRLARGLGTAAPSLKRGRATEVRKRLTQSDLFEEYEQKGEVTENFFAFADLLECSPDASNQVVQEKFDALSSQVQLLNDQGMQEFLDACAQAHSSMLVVK